MKKIIVSLVLGLGMLANVANAAGDVEAGKTKSATCVACHGANGIGTTDMYPNLAGQHADYIAKQLKAFKDGSRVDPVMAPMAAALSDQDMADLGAYFAGLSKNPANAGDATAAAEPAAPAVAEKVADAAAGKYLYENGDESRSIAACEGCHGKEGNSEVLIYPNLSKQHPEYIEKQLVSFKDHARIDPAMNQFASSLTEQDIANIGAYFKNPTAVESVKAAKPVTMTVATSFKGDVSAGKAASATCVACHGVDGNSMVTMYPKIAGQHESYIAKQLKDFKTAAETQNKQGRADPVMAGMVAALTPADIQNLSAYFASQKPTLLDGAANANGKQLYLGGDAARGITACVACHSVNGDGMASAGFPALISQHPDYLKAQLNKFRSGERGNDLNGMMRNIAMKLSDKDIADLAEYMSTMK